MASLIDRIKQRMAAGPGEGFKRLPPQFREKSRAVVANLNRFDDLTYKRTKRTDKIQTVIHDLRVGDEHKGGERPQFDAASQMVEAMFHLAYKAAPRLENKRHLARDLYPVRQIANEIKDHPRLEELHQFTAGDPMMSGVAVEAMAPIVREILERVAEAQPPPTPEQQQQQQQGSGGDNYAQGGGQPGPPQQGQGQGQPQQGQGQGQGQPQQGQGQGGSGQQQGGQQQGGQGQQPSQGSQPSQGQQDPNTQPHEGQNPVAGSDGGSDPADPAGGGQPGEGGDQQGDGPPPPPEERDAEEGDEQEIDTEGDDHYDPEQEWEDLEAAWEDAWDNILGDIDLERLATRAIEAAERTCDELDNLRKDIGLEDGEWALMSPEQRMAMADQLQTEEMRDLSKIVGRMRHFALGVKATKIVDVNHEAFDVEMGNDMRRILRPQLALLYNENTRLEFYRRWVDKELLQYKMRGSEEVGKGPIVVCVDKSSSMNGQPFHWALAVAEALRRFAAEDDRDLYVMFFGNNRDRVRFEFPKGKAPFEKILTFLGTVANGGTQFDGVLTEALDRAVNQFDGEGKEKADIVFITDGSANLSDQWIAEFNAERNRVGVRLYSVYIGGAHDMRKQEGPLALLEKVSDACIPVSELRPDEIKTVFERV